MANPQTEKGYIRIANELWNEILRRDFSKRQLNLILFIWRLSYGTGQKDCVVERFNQFEIVGIYKNDIKKELKFLRECSVLNWDENEMVFSINKNYQTWQITPGKNWDNEKFDKLISQNLSRKKVSKTLTIKKTQVSKTLTFKSKRVSKTLTTKLVKYQLRHDSKSIAISDTGSLKTLLKTLKIKDIKREEEERTENPFKIYEQNFGVLKPILRDSLIAWCDDLGDEIAIAGMKLAAYKGGRTFSYIESIWKEWADQNLKTLEQVRNYENQKKKLYTNTVPFKPRKASGDVDWDNL